MDIINLLNRYPNPYGYRRKRITGQYVPPVDGDPLAKRAQGYSQGQSQASALGGAIDFMQNMANAQFDNQLTKAQRDQLRAERKQIRNLPREDRTAARKSLRQTRRAMRRGNYDANAGANDNANYPVPDYNFDFTEGDQMIQDLPNVVEEFPGDASMESSPINLAPPTAATARDNSSIINEVIRGKWGNGADRKKRLQEAGYSPEEIAEIQRGVNEKIRGRQSAAPTPPAAPTAPTTPDPEEQGYDEYDMSLSQRLQEWYNGGYSNLDPYTENRILQEYAKYREKNPHLPENIIEYSGYNPLFGLYVDYLSRRNDPVINSDGYMYNRKGTMMGNRPEDFYIPAPSDNMRQPSYTMPTANFVERSRR